MKARPIAATKRRNREESMQRLQKAALEIFSKVGYDAATTRMVAKKAGLNESLIQRYFDGKSGLLLSILQTFTDAEEEQVSKIPVKENLIDELNAFYEFQLDKCWRLRGLMKIVISRAIVDKKVGDEMGRKLVRGGIPYLLPRLEKLKAAGKIRDDIDLMVAAFSISSMSFTVGFMAQVVFGRDREELKRQLAETARLLTFALSPSSAT